MIYNANLLYQNAKNIGMQDVQAFFFCEFNKSPWR